MQDWQRRFVDFLVTTGAFRLGSFTLKSGRQSPTFVNTGLVDDGPGLVELGDAYAAGASIGSFVTHVFRVARAAPFSVSSSVSPRKSCASN